MIFLKLNLHPPSTFCGTVDTSSSMNTHQKRLGDVRVVFSTNWRRVDSIFAWAFCRRSPRALTCPAFIHRRRRFSGRQETAASGHQQCLWPGDTSQPYPAGSYGDDNEEPVAAAIQAIDAFVAMSSTAPQSRRLRDGALLVPFFVTDEWTNDANDFFNKDQNRWGNSDAARGRTWLTISLTAVRRGIIHSIR